MLIDTKIKVLEKKIQELHDYEQEVPERMLTLLRELRFVKTKMGGFERAWED